MTIVTTSITVAPDSTISSQILVGHLPPGDHDVLIIAKEATPRAPTKRLLKMEGFPIHNIPWDGGISLHRKDMHDEEGRLR